MKKRNAFTLAEVLITLGIIGIVAAMTLPVLIQKNNNRVVETRLKAFYTTINQAIRMSEAVNGDKKYWWDSLSDVCDTKVDPDNGYSTMYSEKCLMTFYDKYLNGYLKVLKIEMGVNVSNKLPILLIYLPNGSGIWLGYGGHDYYFFPYTLDMKNEKAVHGRDYFLFGLYPTSMTPARCNVSAPYANKGVEPYIYGRSWDKWDCTIKGALDFGWYSYVIRMNNWKIPDDYPYKVKY